MKTEIEKPALEESIKRLQNNEDFGTFIDMVAGFREDNISELIHRPDPFELGKIVGVVFAYDELLDIVGRKTKDRAIKLKPA